MNCKVNSCPLKAEFVTDYDDQGRPKWGMCRYHRMVGAEDWGIVTARIHEYREPMRILQDLDNLTDPIFKPFPGESVDLWLYRVRDNLRRVITGTYHNKTNGEANFAALYTAIGRGKPDAT